MAGWDFPTALEVEGNLWPIRTDFRAILDVMEVLADEDITDAERAYVALSVFYIGYDPMKVDEETAREAARKMIWFINGGEDSEPNAKRKPRLMDWDQDFHLIAPPINKILGYECRSCEYLHWWTFLGAYQEIGECYFQQVVSIRSKLAHCQKLDKSDRDFYNKHRRDIDLKRTVTQSDIDAINTFLG